MAFPGKISRLPAELRDEICRQILDGRTSAEILRQLNQNPEVKKILAADFGGEEISAQNFSAWKQSGYAQWLRRRERFQEMKELSAYASKLSSSGKNLASAGSAILAGKIFELIENLEIGGEDSKTVEVFAAALSKLWHGELQSVKLENDKARLQTARERLNLEQKKFQRATAELFIKYCENAEAKSIALSSKPKKIKMNELVKLMFGEPPKERAGGNG